MIHTFIPSPPVSWQVPISVGDFKVHTYALFILAGIFVALWLTTRRWVERGGAAEDVGEVGFWAIPFGIVGGRIYHVVSTPGPYFGENGHPLDALKIWQGGLGIWGAVAFGALGAYIGCRRKGVSFATFMDSAAPAILFAQAIGRLGNYFNQELFGAPTTLPWGLKIDPQTQSAGFNAMYPEGTLFHPTFLYELLWNVAGAALILYLDRRLRLFGGRVFWLYVMVYVSGRLWIEMLRIDTAVHVGPFRINVWVSIAVLLLGIGMFVATGLRQSRAGKTLDRASLAARPTSIEANAKVEKTARPAAKATTKPAAKAAAKPAAKTAAKPPAKTAAKASAKPTTKTPKAPAASAAKPAAKSAAKPAASRTRAPKKPQAKGDSK